MTTTLDLPFQLGEPRSHGSITITPLFPTRDSVCEYVSLDEALPNGLEIGEVNAAGVVGELAVKNPLGLGVLLYDGEELVGAKQNRILDLTVLAGAGQKVKVPVSCVERGRWSWKGSKFKSAGHVSNPELRRVKAQMLRGGAMQQGVAQGAVWAAVDRQLIAHSVASPTAAAADAYVANRTRVREFSDHFPLEPGQCGAVVSVGGRWCLDAVSRPAVFADLYPKLLAGYVFDSHGSIGESVNPQNVLAYVSAAAARRSNSAGLGEDIRVEGSGVIGSGLAVTDELVQLSAYGDAG